MIVEAHQGKQLMPCMRTDHPSVAISSQFDPPKKIKIKRKIYIKIILNKTLPPPWGSSERAADPSLVFFINRQDHNLFPFLSPNNRA